MIFISIMILIVAIALQSLSPVILSRISAIVFIYAGVLAFNTFYIQAIGSGIGIYSGFFQVSTVSQLFDIFLFFIAGLILIGSPYLNINKIVSNNNSGQYSLIVLFSTLGASLLISFKSLIFYLSEPFLVITLITLILFLFFHKNIFKLNKKILLNLISQFSLNNKSNIQAYFLIILIVVFSIYSLDLYNLSLYKCLLFFLMLLISFLHSMFMSKIFNWSEDIFIRTIQKTFFYSILSSIAIVILNYLGVNFINIIHCDSDDENEGEDEPPAQRIGLGASATFWGAAKLGIEGAKNLSKNLELSLSIKNTKSEKTDSDKIPSPDDTNFSINSPLEEGDIPLLGLINSIFNLNIIELIIIIFILFINNQEKFKKIFLNKIIFYIDNNLPALSPFLFINKKKNKKDRAKYVRVSNFLNSLLIVNSRFNKIIIVYLIVLLILVKILNIYFLYNLNLGIDDFVLVYNYIKKGVS